MNVNKFHDHLDACRQCREHPFDLCLIGAAILRIVATTTKPKRACTCHLAERIACGDDLSKPCPVCTQVVE